MREGIGMTLHIPALTKQGGGLPMFTGFSDFFSSKFDISEAPEGFWEP